MVHVLVYIFIFQDLHVFSYESESLGSETGQRMFLVASYPVFWHYYRYIIQLGSSPGMPICKCMCCMNTVECVPMHRCIHLYFTVTWVSCYWYSCLTGNYTTILLFYILFVWYHIMIQILILHFINQLTTICIEMPMLYKRKISTTGHYERRNCYSQSLRNISHALRNHTRALRNHSHAL